jgi:Amt family ammonium transporter
VLSLGIFANGQYGGGWNGVVRDEFVTKFGFDGVRGLLYGDPSQFVAQLLSCVALITFAATMAFVWFKLSDMITPLRVDAETESEGLDAPEVGVVAYPDFSIHRGGSRHMSE